jgi:hypothetical protein
MVASRIHRTERAWADAREPALQLIWNTTTDLEIEGVVSWIIGAKLPLRYGFSAAFVQGADFAVVFLERMFRFATAEFRPN